MSMRYDITERLSNDIEQDRRNYTFFFYKLLIFWNSPQTLVSKVEKGAPENCLKSCLFFS